MKIISGYKDYYDYLVGIYGEDEKLVYDRRVFKPHRITDLFLSLETGTRLLTFAINGRLHRIVYYKDRFFYTPEELVELRALYEKNEKTNKRRYSYYLDNHGFHSTGFSSLKRAQEFFADPKNTKTDVNMKLRQPVLLTYHTLTSEGFIDEKKIKWVVPILSEFPITKYLPAEEVYKEISELLGWLNDHPEIPNTQTNNEKIVTHGFDPKVSFRHRK